MHYTKRALLLLFRKNTIIQGALALYKRTSDPGECFELSQINGMNENERNERK